MQQEEFKKEVVPLRGRLIAVARGILGDPNDAEDAVQETFLKLWHIKEQLQQVRSIEAMSVQITKNICLNRLNVLKRQTGKQIEDLHMTDHATPYSRLEASDNLERTMRIIDRLPDLQQAILRMKHIEGMEVEEIAELTGSNPEAVRMNLSRARRRVKEIFLKTER